MAPKHNGHGEKFYKCGIMHYNPDTLEFHTTELYIPKGYLYGSTDEKEE